ncbi:MAG: transglutaminase family protein [Chloroflexota bacterium]
MHYLIRHVTKFRYSDPITESVMDVRMQPSSGTRQRCLSFDLRTNPKTIITSFVDDLGNHVHHFDVPDRHTHLTIRAEALVEILPTAPLPLAMDEGAWDALDRMTQGDEYWDMLMPSQFARPTDLLHTLERELRILRLADPLTTLRDTNTAIHDAFEYDAASTRVDSAIDVALASRHGVCQDFAHIMIALVRGMGIPCRYVSGYMYHRSADHDRSPLDATHAWVEALLPDLGWIGFDPTNNLVVEDRHVVAATGRDYADVPPNRGVFKGSAETELAVSVRVSLADGPQVPEPLEEEMDLTYRRTSVIDSLSDDELQEQPQQ